MSKNETNQRGFGRRVLWILRAVLITLLLVTILTVAGMGGYWGFVELRRSFIGMNTRVSLNEHAVDLLEERVNALAEQSPAQARQLNGLQGDVTALEERLARLQQGLTAQETAVADLDVAGKALASRTTALEEGLMAMQSDLITNTAQLDLLRGDVDDMQAGMTLLDGQVAELEQAAMAAVAQADAAAESSQAAALTVAQMQESLLLFRAWELVTRARLRLLESNLGLATADAQLATEVVAALAATFPAEEAAILTQAQTRLAQALANLPGNPNGAALDLELAWDELDRVLALRLGLPERPFAPEAEAAATPAPATQP